MLEESACLRIGDDVVGSLLGACFRSRKRPHALHASSGPSRAKGGGQREVAAEVEYVTMDIGFGTALTTNSNLSRTTSERPNNWEWTLGLPACSVRRLLMALGWVES